MVPQRTIAPSIAGLLRIWGHFWLNIAFWDTPIPPVCCVKYCAKAQWVTGKYRASTYWRPQQHASMFAVFAVRACSTLLCARDQARLSVWL